MTDNTPTPDGEPPSQPDTEPAPTGASATVPADDGATDDAEEVAHLRGEVDELQRQNAALRHTRRWGRARTISSWVLLVLAFLLAVVSVLVVYVRNELLNTDTFVGTVAPLASNPAIQTAIADEVSQQLFAQVNVANQVRSALPPRAAFLATPIADGLETVVNTATLKFVQSSAFEKLWVQMNRQAHGELVDVLTGSQKGSVSSSDGTVSLDTGKVADRVIKQLDSQGITVFDKVPTAKLPTYTLLKSTQLVRAQKATRNLNRLALLLPLLTLVCLAGAVLLARNRRRGLEYAAGSLALAMALLLVALSIGRTEYLNALGGSFSHDALGAVYDALTDHLREVLRILLVLSLVALIAAVLVGNARVRTWLGEVGAQRLSHGPVATFIGVHHKGVRWGIVGVGLALLVLWNSPTPLVVFVVTLIVLAFVAAVSLFRSRRPPSEDAAAGGLSSPPPVDAAT